MSITKLFYNVGYRYFRMPWDIGVREELVSLVESDSIKPGRAIDLGCGTGANAIYLARNGMDVTGVDFAEAAIEKAQGRAKEAGVQVKFIVDDLTDLRKVSGTFEFLLDYGVLDDLRPHQREQYIRNILPLTHPDSLFLLWGFEYPQRWWERFLPFMGIAFYSGEIEERFGKYFEIECLTRKLDFSQWPPGYTAYLLKRKGGIE